MTRRDHVVLTALAVSGALLTFFQNWYISLPAADAVRIDICRISPVINCFTSLHRHGPEVLVFGLPVFPALLALFCMQAGLCAFAWVAAARRADAWLGLMRLASLPASGLAVFVLLNDMMVAKATSVSAILVALVSLAVSVLAVLHGLGKVRLRNAGWPAAGLGLAAALIAFFLHGAGSSRRTYDDFMNEQAAKKMQSVTWPRFAHALPRTGAAALGNPFAPREIVLIVDPSQESSRNLMREAASAAIEMATRVRITIYAPGEHGVDLVLAQQAGTLDAYLRDPQKHKGQPGDRAAAREIVRRQEEAWQEHKPPTGLARGQKYEGDFNLATLLRTIPE